MGAVQDERCAALPVYPILQKVYLERILRQAEVAAFAQDLKPHQVRPQPPTPAPRLAASPSRSNVSCLAQLLLCACPDACSLRAASADRGRVDGAGARGH